MTDLLLPAEYVDGSTLYRAAAIDSLDVDDGTIVGKLAPYGVEAQIGEHLFEQFRAGTFASAMAAPHRVKLRGVDHAREIIGHAVELWEDGGIWGRMKVAATTAGKDALELFRSGAIDELSVEFTPTKGGFDVVKRGAGDLLVTHKRATLRGVSGVGVGAYGREAVVASVRDDSAKLAEEARARLSLFDA